MSGVFHGPTFLSSLLIPLLSHVGRTGLSRTRNKPDHITTPCQLLFPINLRQLSLLEVDMLLVDDLAVSLATGHPKAEN